MKTVIQRVQSASVTVGNRLISEIGPGLLVFVGIHRKDNENLIPLMINKILNLRIFSDNDKLINYSVLDLGLEILLVSQFTLYGNSHKGNRPSFTEAMPFKDAEEYYKNFVKEFRKKYPRVKNGIFGSHMRVALINDGPVTLILEN